MGPVNAPRRGRPSNQPGHGDKVIILVIGIVVVGKEMTPGSIRGSRRSPEQKRGVPGQFPAAPVDRIRFLPPSDLTEALTPQRCNARREGLRRKSSRTRGRDGAAQAGEHGGGGLRAGQVESEDVRVEVSVIEFVRGAEDVLDGVGGLEEIAGGVHCKRDDRER